MSSTEGTDTKRVTTIIGTDSSTDLAILRIDGVTIRPAAVRPAAHKSAPPAVGDHVLAIGNPMGLEQSVSEGIISGLRQTDAGLLIQTTAPISPGSSGGGLYNSQGQLIGITGFTLRESQNLNFAVPIERALQLEADSVAQHREVSWADVSGHFCSKGRVVATKEAEQKSAAPELRPEDHLSRGRAFLQRMDFEEAEQEFRAAKELQPRSAETHYLLGVALLDQQNLMGADAELGEAVRLKPDFALAHLAIGRTSISRDDKTTAFLEFQKAYMLDPEQPNIRKEYAQALMESWPSLIIPPEGHLPTTWSDTWRFYVYHCSPDDAVGCWGDTPAGSAIGLFRWFPEILWTPALFHQFLSKLRRLFPANMIYADFSYH